MEDPEPHSKKYVIYSQPMAPDHQHQGPTGGSLKMCTCLSYTPVLLLQNRLAWGKSLGVRIYNNLPR